MAMVTDIMATDMVKVIMVINESNMKIKTYVINLKDSVDRRKAILAETAKYPFMDVELVEAVDGRKLKQEEIKACFDLKKFVNHYYRTPKGGEIGCTLSHRICYRKLLESEEEFALVLEDDVCFIYPEYVETILNDILNEYKDNKPYVITLGYHDLYYPKKYRTLGKFTFYKIYRAYGTCGYLVNRQAAKRLLSDCSFIVADDFSFMREKGIQVEGIYLYFAADESTRGTIPSEIQQEKVTRKNFINRCISRCCRLISCRMLLKFGRLSKQHYSRGIDE